MRLFSSAESSTIVSCGGGVGMGQSRRQDRFAGGQDVKLGNFLSGERPRSETVQQLFYTAGGVKFGYFAN